MRATTRVPTPLPPTPAFTGRFFEKRAVRPRFLIRWSLQRKPEYQEESHVSPRLIIAMGTHRVNVFATPESPASAGAGLLELWDGVGQILWHQQCGGAAFAAAAAIGGDA